MFNLIVSVIAIALSAALAAASIYYGGSAFTNSTAKANVTTLVNQGQQIAGAGALYKVDNAGTPPASLADLTQPDNAAAGVVNYLQAAPVAPAFATGAWETNGAVAYVQIKPNAVNNLCAEVEKQNGSLVQNSSQPWSVTEAAGRLNSASAQFSCQGSDPAASYFSFKM
ncbi:hypothetical protein AX289_09610 [Methylorubrum populi]|nr:hypothetical protein AX289_09610 [Methylorubrum populi]